MVPIWSHRVPIWSHRVPIWPHRVPIWAPNINWGHNLGPQLIIGPLGPLFIYFGGPGALIYLFWAPWGPQLFIYLWALRALVGP